MLTGACTCAPSPEPENGPEPRAGGNDGFAGMDQSKPTAHDVIGADIEDRRRRDRGLRRRGGPGRGRPHGRRQKGEHAGESLAGIGHDRPDGVGGVGEHAGVRCPLLGGRARRRAGRRRRGLRQLRRGPLHHHGLAHLDELDDQIAEDLLERLRPGRGAGQKPAQLRIERRLDRAERRSPHLLLRRDRLLVEAQHVGVVLVLQLGVFIQNACTLRRVSRRTRAFDSAVPVRLRIPSGFRLEHRELLILCDLELAHLGVEQTFCSASADAGRLIGAAERQLSRLD